MSGCCEHEFICTYTYRDWYETGIPEGTVCEDCGGELCHRCAGVGWPGFAMFPCPDCGGTGQLAVNR